MWNKIKNIFAYIGGILVAALLLLLGRRGLHGRAGDSAESALERAREGAEECQGELERAEGAAGRSQERIAESEERINRSTELSEEITGNIDRAEGHAQAIREILKSGKSKEPVGKG